VTGIGQQVADLAWRDAWRHELRGPHGEWMKAGGAVAAAARAYGNVKPLAPAPHPYGKDHFGSVSEEPGITWPTEEMRAGATEEALHGLDLQGKFVPAIADKVHIALADMDDDINGQTLSKTEVLIDAADTQMYGSYALKWDHLAPQEIQARDQKSGWWVPSDPQYTLADTTVAHEMGHVIADTVGHKFSRELWDKLADAAGLLPPAGARGKATVTPSNLADWAMRNHYALEKNVSGYGMSNIGEIMAEMWSEYTMSSNPRPMAKAYGEWVTAKLRETGKL
jgi:hypothetical protein